MYRPNDNIFLSKRITASGREHVCYRKGIISFLIFLVSFSFTTSAQSVTQISSSNNPACSNIAVTFTANITPASATGTVEFFIGGTSLAAPVTVSGGVASLTVPNLPIGTHPIIAFYSGDFDNLPSSASIDQMIEPLPTATISYAGPFCQSDGSAQAVSLTGTGNFSVGTFTASPAGLFINPGTGSIIPSSSSSGNYIVTYTIPATTACEAVSTTTPITITAPPAATISYPGSPFCSGGPGNYSVNLVGTSGGSFSSTPGLTINPVTGAITPATSTAGNYLVTYTIPPSGGCAGTSVTTNVSVVNPPTANFSYPATPYCPGPGTATPTIAPGSLAGIFSSTTGLVFSNTATGAVNLAASTPGSYVVTNTIPAANGCAAITSTSNIVIHPLFTANVTANYCIGGGKIRLTANVSPAGSYSYQWSTGSTSSFVDIDIAANYSVTVTNNSTGCKVTTGITISRELAVNGDFSMGNTGFNSAYTNNQEQYIGAPTGLIMEGLYAVGNDAHYHHPLFWGHDHTTGNGNFMIVNGSPPPDGRVVWEEGPIAINPNTTYYFSGWAMSLNPDPPFAQLQFNVDGGSGPISIGTTAVLDAGVSNNSNAGWVRFYGTWNSGSSTTATFYIVDLQTDFGGNDFGIDDISISTLAPTPFSVAPIAIGEGANGSVCAGGTIMLDPNMTGGVDPFTYSWTGPNGFNSDDRNPVLSTNATAALNGTYSLTIMDFYGCPVSASVNVIVKPLPVVSNQTVTICSGGSFSMTPPSSLVGTTYTWDIPGGSGFTGGVAQPVAQTSVSGRLFNSTTNPVTATYTVTPTAGGCPGQPFTVTVTINPSPVISNQTVSICSGSTFTVSPTGVPSGTNYTWGAPAISPAGAIQGTSAQFVAQNSISQTLINNTANPATATYTVTPVSGICVGNTFRIVVTVVPIPPIPTATVIEPTCPVPSGTITVTSPIGAGYEYSVDGSAFQTSRIFPGIPPGTHSIIVRSSVNNSCVSSVGTAVVGPLPPPVTLSETHTNIICNGGSTGSIDLSIVTGTGPYSYSWSNGSNNQDLNSIPAGNYSVTVTDAKGCIATLNTTVTQATPVIASQSHTPILCHSGSSTVTITGSGGAGGPYSGTGTFIQAVGTVSYTIADAAGCQATVSVTIAEPAPLSVNYIKTDVLCHGESSGSVLIIPSGGSGGYSINRPTSALAAGLHSFEITDANGCLATLDVTIDEPAAVVATISGNTTICQGSSTALTVTMNGIAPWSITYTNGITPVTVNNILSSPYSISVTPSTTTTYALTAISDANCVGTVSGSANITVTQKIDPQFEPIGPFCQDHPAIPLPLVSDNGISGTWSPSSINTAIAGTLTYTFTPTNGLCANSTTMGITVNPTTSSPTGVTVCSDQLPFRWNLVDYFSAGSYQQILVNAAGCDSIAHLNLDVLPEIIPVFNPFGSYCRGSVAPALAPVSNNGITGIWSPSTINTNVIGITDYTFIPMTGVCVRTITVQIEIADLVVPVFNNIGPLCLGSIAPPLPPLSSNGISGSWSPSSINTSAAGTTNYTFTPGSGLCAQPLTIAVLVNPTSTASIDTIVCTNAFPFTWHGQAIIGAGNYTYTTLNSLGCDSTTTLHVSTKPLSIVNIDSTVCADVIPFTWNSQLIVAAGNYTYTTVAANGCDSVTNLHLIVNPLKTVTIDSTVCANGLPFTWNGQSVTGAGTYNYHSTTSLGCDSTTILQVLVNPVVTRNIDSTVCADAIPFVWNGMTISSAGTYPYLTSGSSGCDSTTILHLSVNPLIDVDIDSTVCSNDLPITWNSILITGPGNYDYTTVAASGCDSTIHLHLLVNPVSLSNTDSTVCANNLPFIWNGQTINGPGTYTYLTTNVFGCDSTATLHLDIQPLGTLVIDSTVCENAIPFNWNGLAITGPGTYNFISPGTLGCDSTVTLNLSVFSVANTIIDSTVCENGIPFTWNGQSITGAGTYSYNTTSSAGCDSTTILNLSVNSVANTVIDSTVCENGIPFTWNGQSITGAGTYSYNTTSSAGCDSTTILNLSVFSVANTIIDSIVCENGIPFTWNGQTITGAGTYTYNTTSSAGCDSTTILNLSVFSVANTIIDSTVCENAIPFDWNGQSITGAGTYSYNTTSSAGCDSTTILNLSVFSVANTIIDSTVCENAVPFDWNGQSITGAGTYSYNTTSSAGCDSTTILNLSVFSVANTIIDSTVCENAIPFDWNGQSITGAGTYSYNTTSSAGCDSTTILNLSVFSVANTIIDSTVCENAIPFDWNGQTITGAGTYSYNTTSSAGCDSTTILNLSVFSVANTVIDSTICENGIPFTWNGQFITGAGTYTFTTSSSAGCDSTTTLNLSVSSVANTVIDSTVCENEIPFAWNGQSITGAGTYSYNTTSSVGCDSTTILNLSVFSVANTVIDSTICENGVPFAWNGQTITGAGTYSYNTTSSAGCDSTTILNLSVFSVANTIIDSTICENGIPFTWNGQFITGAGTYTFTTSSSAGCDSTTTLNLSVSSVANTVIDSTVCENEIPFNWNGQSITGAGTYSFTTISSAGCDSTTILNLSVFSVANTIIDSTICENGIPFTWNGQFITGAGTYTFTTSSSAGCDSTTTLNLSVFSVANTVIDSTVCENAVPFDWNGQSITGAGTYSYNTTSSVGCDSTTILNLSVFSVANTIIDSTVCENAVPFDWNGQSITGAGTYSYNTTSSAGCDSTTVLNLSVFSVANTIIDSIVCENAVPFDWNGQSITGAGTYSYNTTSSAGCDSTTILNLSVFSVANTIIDSTVCENGVPFDWNGQSITGAGTYSYNTTSSAGCDSTTILNLSVISVANTIIDSTVCENAIPFDWNGQSITGAGTYSYNTTSSAGCDSTTILNLSVFSVANTIIDSTVCENGVPFDWNGQSITGAGTYSYNTTSSAGCDSTTILNLSVISVANTIIDSTVCENAIPFDWNGQSITGAGTYSYNTTSSAGCDSTTILNLSVISVANTIIDSTVCENAIPFDWNGQSITGAGTYSFTRISSAGCDSTTTLNLSVNSVANTVIDSTVCENGIPFTWNGQMITGAGTYTYTTTSSAGCDSTTILNLSVFSVANTIIDSTVCENAVPFDWNGQSITGAGTYSYNTTSSVGCDSTTILNLSVFSVANTIIDSTVCENAVPFDWNGQSITGAGTYTFSTTSSAGCDSTTTLNLSVSSVANTIIDSTVCENGVPLTWNGQSITSAGTYSFTTTSSAGCDSTTILNLSVFSVANTIIDSTVCENGVPFTWNGQTITGAGTYSFTTTSSAGCDSTTTLNLSVSSVLNIVIDSTVCENGIPFNWNGQTITGAGTYSYNTTSSAGCDSTTILNLSVFSVAVTIIDSTVCENGVPFTWNGQTITGAGTYSFTTISSAGCDSTTTLNLSVNSVANTVIDSTVCENGIPFTWNGQSITGAGTYTYNTTSSVGCDSTTILNLSVFSVANTIIDSTVCENAVPFTWNGQTITGAGTYSYNTTSSAGCDSTTILNLSVFSVANTIIDSTVCENAVPFDWNGQSITGAGTYTYTTTSSAGCDSTTILNLSVFSVAVTIIDSTVCENGVPFTWNGQTITGAGTYSFTTISSAGCDSTTTLNLSVNSVANTVIDSTVCENGIPFTWNGQSITGAGTYTYNTTSSVGCDSTTILNLSVFSVANTIIDSTVCENAVPFTWNGQSITGAGTYTYNTTSSVGCDSTTILNLSVFSVANTIIDSTVCENAVPFDWNGQSITGAGTYSYNTTSSVGCDSTTILNLSVFSVANTIIDSTVCENAVPFDWNGQSITGAGTYSYNTTSSVGCDSTTILNLSVFSVANTIIDSTVCENAVPFTWNGQTITGAGTYSYNTTSSAGCDSTTILNLSVFSVANTIIDSTVCENAVPFDWNGQSITGAGTYSYNTTSSAGCDSTTILNLSVFSVANTIIDSTVCENAVPFDWNGQSITGAGTYSFTTTSSAGCDSTTTLNLSVNFVANTVIDSTVCENGIPFTWNGQTITGAGTYTYNTTSSVGCDSTTILNLSVFSVANTIIDSTVCQNAIPFTWNGQAITGPGTYTFTSPSAGGCDSTITLHLTLSSQLNIIIDSSVCANQLPFMWNGQLINAQGDYNYITPGSGGCDSMTTLRLAVRELPKAIISGNATICAGSSSQLAVSFTGTGPFGFTYSDGINSFTFSPVNSASYAFNVSPSTTTTYTITGTSDDGCANTGDRNSAVVTVLPPIQPLRYPDVIASPNTAIPLSAQNFGSNTQYSWEPGAGLNDPSLVNPVFNYDRAMDYKIRIVTPAGCEVVDTLRVKLKQEGPLTSAPELFVPKAWTPNSDGHNDKLFPLTYRIRELRSFRVFNRWGQLMFESSAIGQGWDGKYRGQEQASDTYTWTAQAIGDDGKIINRSGNSVLLR